MLFSLLLLVIAPATSIGDEDPLLLKSRNTADRFANLLQSALQEAMAVGGPVNAIGVCKDMAPRIASKLSRETGARVSRTSLRFRNAANAPEPWETAVLEKFDASGSADTAVEYFQRFGKNAARYMKPIPTSSLCLSCHGTAVTPEVMAILARDYPHDRARGYAAGDIRGAFSIVWPDSD